MSPRMNTPHALPRGGFSLVELMIVIVVIAILVALLLPAIGTIRGTVREKEVRTEIAGFDSGITQFKSEFGREPPSRITLYEVAADWDTSSRTLIREMWPQFDFSNRDLDGDGMDDEADPDGDGNPGITLTGAECLVFFLGGPDSITNTSDATDRAVANGFSKNPRDPFASGGSRIGPFHEFDPDRMIDVDGDGAHSYNDLYPETSVPYLYLSSYEGRGYRPSSDADLNGSGVTGDDARELFTSIDHDGTDGVDTQDEIGYSVYLQAESDSSLPSDLDGARDPDEVPWKGSSYQIISAGEDGVFGCGGLWSADNGISHIFIPSESNYKVLNVREAGDNLTNFTAGTLE